MRCLAERVSPIPPHLASIFEPIKFPYTIATTKHSAALRRRIPPADGEKDSQQGGRRCIRLQSAGDLRGFGSAEGALGEHAPFGDRKVRLKERRRGEIETQDCATRGKGQRLRPSSLSYSLWDRIAPTLAPTASRPTDSSPSVPGKGMETGASSMPYIVNE